MPDNSNLLSQCYVKIEGADAPEDFMRALVEVTVDSSLHLPDVATLILQDPRLRWIDEARLAPGKTIEIATKSAQGNEKLFDGEIVELEPDFTPATQRLVVRAFDRLHRLARGRHVRTFLNVSDGDLVQRVGQEAGLQVSVGPTRQIHDYVLQGNQTNLEFLQGRAASLGYLLFVREKTLHCEPPKANGTVSLEWGKTLSEFHPRMTTVEQIESVTARGWDPAQKEAIVGQARDGRGTPKVGESRSGGAVANEAYRITAQGLVTDRPIRKQALADQVAQATADRKASRFIEAEGTGVGNPKIIAGAAVQVKSVGERFSGTYFVTAATHIYAAEQGYTTHFSVSGQFPVTLGNLLTPEREGVPTGGLVIGIVTDNQDPEGLGRVKVKYPWLSGEHASDWARLVVPGGGADRGIEFIPEVNDEVLVGFELGDLHFPYVIGGLWNGQDAPPKPSSQVVSGGRVKERIIRSRTGHVITLDDSDGGGGVTIEDKNGNKIQLDSGQNSLTIEVAGNAKVTSKGNLTLEATGKVEIKGMGVKVDGGAATVDVTATMINLN